MNCLEKKMVQLLRELREDHHVSGVKAEFEPSFSILKNENLKWTSLLRVLSIKHMF